MKRTINTIAILFSLLGIYCAIQLDRQRELNNELRYSLLKIENKAKLEPKTSIKAQVVSNILTDAELCDIIYKKRLKSK